MPGLCQLRPQLVFSKNKQAETQYVFTAKNFFKTFFAFFCSTSTQPLHTFGFFVPAKSPTRVPVGQKVGPTKDQHASARAFVEILEFRNQEIGKFLRKPEYP